MFSIWFSSFLVKCYLNSNDITLKIGIIFAEEDVLQCFTVYSCWLAKAVASVVFQMH